MKKFAVLLFSIVIAVVASVTAFAASSPSGPVIDDKYDLVGKVTKDDKAYSGITVAFDGSETKVTGEDGTVKFEDVAVGTHKIFFSKDTTTLDEITINVIKGEETKSVKTADDVYDVYVKSGVSTIYINFDAASESDIVITGANSVGNDSPDSPPTGDYSVYAICFALMVAFSGILVSGYFKKRFN